MREPVEYSRCDDGLVMIHTAGDVLAFVYGSKCPPEDEMLARLIVEAVNSHEALVAENKRLREYYDASVDMALTGLLNATYAQVMRLHDARAAIHEHDTRAAPSTPSPESQP